MAVLFPEMPTYASTQQPSPEWAPADAITAARLCAIVGVEGPVFVLSSPLRPPAGIYKIIHSERSVVVKIVAFRRSTVLQVADAMVLNLSGDAPVVRPLTHLHQDFDDSHKIHVYPFIDGRMVAPSAADLWRAGSVIARLHQMLAHHPDQDSIRAQGMNSHAQMATFAKRLPQQLVGMPAELQKAITKIAAYPITMGWEQAQPLHGDLNIGNILLADDGRDVVLDFESLFNSWGSIDLDVAFALERLCLANMSTPQKAIILCRSFVAGYREAGGQQLFQQPGTFENALRILNWRALMILGLLAEKGNERPLSEWEKFVSLWSFIDQNPALVAKIEAVCSDREETRPVGRALLSARDPNAAAQIIALFEANQAMNWFDMSVVGEPPALDILCSAGVPVQPANGAAAGQSVDGCIENARPIIAHHKPDLIITGSSGPGFGIDEGLQAAATDIPTMVVQDFWGDVNTTCGNSANQYAVMDKLACQLTKERVSSRVVQTGQPKYRCYEQYAGADQLAAARAALNCNDDEFLLVFAGQSLWAQSAYCAAFTLFLGALEACQQRIKRKIRTLYRPHPKETKKAIQVVHRLSEKAGVVIEHDPCPDDMDAIVAANVLVTCFSQTAYDKIMLNRLAKTAFGSALHVFPEEMALFYQQSTGTRFLPTHELGLADCARSHVEVVDALSRAADPDAAARYRQTALSVIPDPRTAAGRVLMEAYDLWHRKQ